MKTIFLKKLELSNFKGIKALSIDFTAHETNILGANGTGKTTVFDAFTWLLFGKDSHERKDFNIKTLDASGKSKPKTEHIVQGVISVDGSDVTLKRVFKEKWTKKSGKLELEFDGNTTDFFINDVPKQQKEYVKEISEILDESIFKLISNPKYFANLGWKEQREILFTISGTISDAEIANGNKEFSELLMKLNGKKLHDYKLQISNTKKLLKDNLNAIPTRIDEAERSKPTEIPNFSAIEAKIKETQANLNGVSDAIEDQSKAYQRSFESHQKTLGDINNLKSEQQKIIFSAKESSMKESRLKQLSRMELSQKLQSEQSSLKNKKDLLMSLKSDVNELEKKLLNLRESWYTADLKTYDPGNDGKLICPIWKKVCGDPESIRLHNENEKKAMESFNEDKVRILNKINNDGIQTKEKIQTTQSDITEIKDMIGYIEIEIRSIEEKLKEYPENEPETEVDPASIKEWVHLQSAITELEQTINKEVKPVDTSELKAQRSDLIKELQELTNELNIKDIIKRADKRIDELETEGKNLAQQLSDLEKDEFIIDQFSKARIEESESRINSRFEYVKFKLFDVLVNGSEVETCQMTINGVPYNDANTASQINAGIDVIRVLTKFHGITAPVFIDNRESVTDLIDTNSQIINLIVSSDKKLQIK